jgi:hypothetical protein
MDKDDLLLVIPRIAGKQIALIKKQDDDTDDLDIYEMSGEKMDYLISIHLNEFTSSCLDQNIDILKTLFKMLEVYLATGYTFN